MPTGACVPVAVLGEIRGGVTSRVLGTCHFKVTWRIAVTGDLGRGGLGISLSPRCEYTHSMVSSDILSHRFPIELVFQGGLGATGAARRQCSDLGDSAAISTLYPSQVG